MNTSEKSLKQKKGVMWGEDMVQIIEHLLIKFEALSSNPCTAK
jgi:hypothetical protein